MKNIYTMDWHIHTEASYDATIPLEEIIQKTKEAGITEFGITEHVNYPFMESHLQISKDIFNRKMYQHADDNLNMHFGVELSPISNFQQQYSKEHEWDLYPPLLAGMHPIFVEGWGTHDSELVRLSKEKAKPYELALTEEELRANKVEYVIAAAHVILDGSNERDAIIKHWHEQQMFCATDSRVDIVGHPWNAPWSSEIHFATIERGKWPAEKAWVSDFSVVSQSMHDEFAAALLQYDKCAEMNMSFFYSEYYSEKFKYQYAEYMRMLFEKGVRITTGTDMHDNYEIHQELSAKYLVSAGFKVEDFSRPNFRVYE